MSRLQKPTAVVWQRLLSYIIDSLVISVVISIFWLILTAKIDKDLVAPGSGGFDIGDKRYAFDSDANRGLWTLLSIATVIVISIVLPGIKGTSPGRAAAGIRLVDEDGTSPGVLKAFVRWVAWLVDQFPYFIPLVGPVCAFATQRNQRVGDMITKTYTVKKEYAGSPIQFQGGGAPVQYGSPPPVGGYSPPPPVVQASGGQPADWYPDPHGQARLRYWDGNAWTEHTSN